MMGVYGGSGVVGCGVVMGVGCGSCVVGDSGGGIGDGRW